MKQESRQRIIAALHRSRLQPYLDASDGNEKKALQLYEWHSDLTAATQSILGTTEVILRNAMDRQLQAWNANQPRAESTVSWLLAPPAPPLRSLCSGKRTTALDRAHKESERRGNTHRRFGKPVGHDDVLAQVMFGMWKDLLPNHDPNSSSNNRSNRNRRLLWNEALSKAFTDDPDGEKTYWRVTHIHYLRNRVSHMESLLDIDVNDQIREAFALIHSIDPQVANWVTSTNRVPEILRRSPRLQA